MTREEDRASRAQVVRTVKQQVRLVAGGLDPSGLLAAYVDEIPIQVSTRGKPGRAGQAGFFFGLGTGDVGRIVINVGVCYTEERFASTLLHELAHALNHWHHGNEADVHGPKWKEMMRRLGQEPARCHNYPDRK